MPKAEMRTAKRTARKDPSIFFFLSFRKRNLDFTLKRCFRVSEKRKKVREEKRVFIRGGRLFSRQRAIYTHINGDHTSE